MILYSIPSLSELLQRHPSLKAIFWDMDGTLLNSEYLHALASKDILSDFIKDFKGNIEEVEKKCTGLSDAQVISYLNTLTPISMNGEEFAKKKNEFFLKMDVKKEKWTILNPKIESLLQEAKTKDISLYVVTSSEREVTDHLLSSLELKKYFNRIFTRKETIETKPSPIPYLMALKESGFKENDCLIFEDSEVGVTAATRAHIPFYQVKWHPLVK